MNTDNRQFSREDLIKIVERASSITERLGANFIFDEIPECETIVNSRIENWCQVVAQGNWEQFKKRLEWDGFDLNTSRHALGSVRISQKEQLPAWAETLNECMKGIPSGILENLDNTLSNSRFLDPDWPLPFEDILLSFIYVARQKLIAQAGSCYHLFSNFDRLTLPNPYSLVVPSGRGTPINQGLSIASRPNQLLSDFL